MRGYVMLTDGLHKILDFYSLKNDGYHKWLNWSIQQQSAEVIVFSYELPTLDDSVRFEIYYNTSDPKDADGNIIYTARVIGTGTPDPNAGTVNMASNETVQTYIPYIRYLKVWDDVKPFFYDRIFQDFTAAESAKIADSCTYFAKYTFYRNTALITAQISPATTEIGDAAFGECSSLSSIELHDGIIRIGSYAFQLSGLNSIIVPSSVTDMGRYAFANCKQIVTASILNDILSEFCFYQCTSLQNVSLSDGLTEIPRSAFMQCTALEEITIPDTVTDIRTAAFSGCSSMASATIGISVKNIEQQAFTGAGIITLKTPASLETMGTDVFNACKQLINADLSDSIITTIPDRTFYNCSAMTECSLPDTVTEINLRAFYGCSALSSINMPALIESIGQEAFRNCSSLSSINLNSVKTIGNSAFAGSGLESITIPASVESLGTRAFYSCKKLKSAIINAREIGQEVFYGDSALVDVTLSNTVEVIGYQAFYTCKALQSIVIPASVTTIEGYAFMGCSSLVTIDMTACTAGSITLTRGVFYTIAQGSVIIVSDADLKTYIENPDNGFIMADGRTTVELV